MIELFILFTLCLTQAGCKRLVGDECTADAQCGDGRVCDLLSEGGYCTLSPCERGACPEESICVLFENRQSFCMVTCQSTDDCREGYLCDEATGVAPFCRQSE